MLRFSVFVLLLMVTFAQTAYNAESYTHAHTVSIEDHRHPNAVGDSPVHSHDNVVITHTHAGGDVTHKHTLQISGLGYGDKNQHEHDYKFVSSDGDDTDNGVTDPTDTTNPTTGTTNPTNPTTSNLSTTPDNTQADSGNTGSDTPLIPTPQQDTVPPQQDAPMRIEVTEYMVRDWSPQSGGGLPQWVEVYNPNPDPVDLDGWTFQYATRAAVNHPYRFRNISISEATIAPEGTLIFVTRKVRRGVGPAIQDSQIYNLRIDTVLKFGWKIIGPDNEVIHQIGTAFGGEEDPVAPLHQDGARVSYHVIESVDPSESYYYGAEQDIGSPGFHEPALPSAPALIRPKKISVWADLKRRAER